MSVTVQIDGQPADEVFSNRAILAMLGPVPDESNRTCQIWTHAPQQAATADSVWLNPHDTNLASAWLASGGAVIHSHTIHGRFIDRLEQGASNAVAASSTQDQLAPVLAAFLTHDFPLIDALMLARAFRGEGWPYRLADFPVPVGGPKSDAAFPECPRNFGLYAVAPNSEWVRRLAAAEVPVVQLRDKRTDSTLRAQSIESSVQAVENSSTLLFINDDWPLAIQHCAYGVHLGQEDLESADLAAIHAAGLRLGISTHGIYEMLRAHACRPSYMALGAIYETATKVMPSAPQGLRRLAHYVKLMSSHYPLVAIGGIDSSRVKDVWSTGVDSVAVLRAIVDVTDYATATSNLLVLTGHPPAASVA